MLRIHPILFFLLSSLAFSLAGCGDGKQTQSHSDTYDSGEVTIVVDETLKPIIAQTVEAFENAYPKATINAVYLPQEEAYQRLVNPEDSVRLLIGTRELRTEEMAFFKKKKYTPDVNLIAVDGISVVVHPDNPDSVLSVVQLKDLLTGKITQWNQLNPQRAKGDSITLVFDDGSSSTLQFLADSVVKGELALDRLYAAGSNPKVLQYVSENPNAIGFIGYNWISDTDEPEARKFLEMVQQVALDHQNNDGKYIYLTPEYSNFYLYSEAYPLRRHIFTIKREAHRGLGTGFESYISGTDGQKIIHTSGLRATNVVTRQVQLEEGDLREGQK